MTKPNGKPCYRCGINPREGTLTGMLCRECRGKCKACGAPAEVRPGGYFCTYCAKCRVKAERRDTCIKCGAVRDGSHTSYCKACYNAYSREWVKRNPTKRQQVEFSQSLKKASKRLKVPRLTVDQYNAILATQGGGCAICGTTTPGGRGSFHIDHCHTTGRFRALLCTHCNVALGLANDDPVRLRAMAEYVEHHAALAAEPAELFAT